MDFLQKYELLKKSIPVRAVEVGQFTQNCSYVDYVYQSKNSFNSFDSVLLEECVYCTSCWGSYLVDCDYCTKSELCYQSLDSNKCYECTYIQNCNECSNCHFCFLCTNCTNCFGCVSLSFKEYCIHNKQYSKEEYFQRLKELKKQPPSKIEEKFTSLKNTIPIPQSFQHQNINCPYGDYLYDSKNVYWGFNTYSLEDSGYVFLGGVRTKYCWDMFFSGSGMELCYEMTDCNGCYHSCYLQTCSDCTNCYHSSYLRNCEECFGCVALSNKKYCILNNQFEKEEYEKSVEKIKRELGWKQV